MTANLITLSNPASAAAEAYRTLRLNIEFSNVDTKLKTLLVASPGPDNEREVVLANLAVTLADGGRKVIVVDAELRHPRLHTLFGLNNSKGFSDMFLDEAAFEEPPLQNVTNTSLHILTSGPLPPIPSQILNSAKINQVLEKLSNIADMVLFNAPPLITVTDAALLASKVDGTLLVVKANISKRDHVKEAKNRLEKVNARLIGAVLSNAALDSNLKEYYAT